MVLVDLVLQDPLGPGHLGGVGHPQLVTLEELRGAAFPTAGPAAVGQAVVELVPRHPAVDRVVHELVHQGGDGGVQHEGDQEQEGKHGDDGNSS